MHKYLEHHPWKIIEKGFHPQYNRISESLFSLGNGRFGQRGNFEEKYSGDSLTGNYIGGVYYEDKTRVGWWKNGYPEYFAKVLNACNWLPIRIKLGNEELDLHKAKILDFQRELDMQSGVLTRKYSVELENSAIIHAKWTRFISMSHDDLASIQLSFSLENYEGPIELLSYLDGDVHNEDANYDEYFWKDIEKARLKDKVHLKMCTRKTDFEVSHGQVNHFSSSDGSDTKDIHFESERQIGHRYEWNHKSGVEYTFTKYVSVLSSLQHPVDKHRDIIYNYLDSAFRTGFEMLLKEHSIKWADKWAWNDISIEGDIAAQQGIRFNIFQLNQTYTGDDDRLNIGPKGFTGEKYGGSTYWDTEAYCLPFYQSTADQKVAKNLLLYRYKQLPKAIENAEKLGFSGGAALYPMVTMNGEECHNEWEITFEEIHRNGAIAYAIFNYIRYTGDDAYLLEAGLEVLIAIARFWAQRFNYSKAKEAYVMLGVTGPNEYENNVNNNWYTNYIARWCLNYTREQIIGLQKSAEQLKPIIEKASLDERELENWKEIADNIYFPVDQKTGLFLQQDSFLDKEIIPVSELDDIHKPLVDNWSWDRILRSCYIKQADVLQGMFFFEDQFSKETIKKHFEFYEPITVHESSLSPCVHSILAASIGKQDKAYEFYLRTARLDLDDYNHDTRDGCHTTSMAGTWMSVVQGFGGMRVQDDILCFDPFIPNQWDSFSFHIAYRGANLQINVSKAETKIIHTEGPDIQLRLKGKIVELKNGESISS